MSVTEGLIIVNAAFIQLIIIVIFTKVTLSPYIIILLPASASLSFTLFLLSTQSVCISSWHRHLFKSIIITYYHIFTLSGFKSFHHRQHVFHQVVIYYSMCHIPKIYYRWQQFISLSPSLYHHHYHHPPPKKHQLHVDEMNEQLAFSLYFHTPDSLLNGFLNSTEQKTQKRLLIHLVIHFIFIIS